MATFSSSIYGGYQWFINATESDFNASQNTSKLTVTLYVKKVGANNTAYGNDTTARITLDGCVCKTTRIAFDMRYSPIGSVLTLATYSTTVKHDSTGQGSIKITAIHMNHTNISDVIFHSYYSLQKIHATNNLSINDLYVTSDTYKENGQYVAGKTALNIRCVPISPSCELAYVKYELSGAYNYSVTYSDMKYLLWKTPVIPNKGKLNIKATVVDALGNQRSKTISVTIGESHYLNIDRFYVSTTDTYNENGKYIANKTAFKLRCHLSHTAEIKSIKYEAMGAHSQSYTYDSSMGAYTNYMTWITNTVKNKGNITFKLTVTDSTGAVRTSSITVLVEGAHKLTINDFYITNDTYKENGNYVPGKTAFKYKLDVAHTEALKSIKYEVTGAHTQTDYFTSNLSNYLTWATTTVKKSGQVNIKATVTDTSGATATRTISVMVSENHTLKIDSFYITSDTYRENGQYVANKTAFKYKLNVTNSHPLKSIKYEVTGAHTQTDTFTSNLNNYLTWATTTVKKTGTIYIKATVTDSYGSVVTKTITANVGAAIVPHELSIQDSYLDTSIAKNLVNGSYFKNVSRLGIRFIIKKSHIVTSLTVTVGSKVYTLNPCIYPSGTGYTVPDVFSTQGNVKVTLTIKDDQGYTDSKTFTVFVDSEVSDPDVPIISYESRTDNYVLLSEGEKITFTGKSTDIKDYQIIYALSSCDVINATSIYTSSSSYNGAARSELSTRLKNNATGDLRYIIYKDFDKDDKAVYQDSAIKNKFHLHPTTPNHSNEDRFYALQWFEHAKPGDMIYVYVIERIKKMVVQSVPSTPPVSSSPIITAFYITNDTYTENGAYVAGKTAFKLRCEVDSVNKISNIQYEVSGAHTQTDSFNPPSSNYYTWSTTTVTEPGTVTIKLTITDVAGKTATKTINAIVGPGDNNLLINKFYITENTVRKNGRYITGEWIEVRCEAISKVNMLASVKYEITGAYNYSVTFTDMRYLLWTSPRITTSGNIAIKVTLTDSKGNKVSKTIHTIVYPSVGYYNTYDMEKTVSTASNYVPYDEQMYYKSGIAYLSMFKYTNMELLDKQLIVTVDLEGAQTTLHYYKAYVSEDNINWIDCPYHSTNGYFQPTETTSYVGINLPYTFRNNIRNKKSATVYVKVDVHTQSGVLKSSLLGKTIYCYPDYFNDKFAHNLEITRFYISTTDTYNENGKYIVGKTAFKVRCHFSNSHPIKQMKYEVFGAINDSQTYDTTINSYTHYMTWETGIVQKAGNVTFRVTILDELGYSASETFVVNVGEVKLVETFKYSTEYKWNQIPRSAMFPMCVLPLAPGAIQIYEKEKTNDKIVIQYKNPIFNWNLGTKNPIHLIDICLIATDKSGNVLNKSENKKRDGKNGRSWVYYSDRKWHVVVPKSTSAVNNKDIFTMEFDISKYKDANISIVAFYYTDYYVHPSIYSTSNILRTGNQNLGLSLQFIDPANNSVVSTQNPDLKLRLSLNKKTATMDYSIYHNYDNAVKWNKSTWESNPIWFRCPRTNSSQVPYFKESERYVDNSPYGSSDYPVHTVEFYKQQESVYKTSKFTLSVTEKPSSMYKTNELFLRVRNNIMDLGEIDNDHLLNKNYIDYIWSSAEKILLPGDNKIEAYTCPYNYGDPYIDFKEFNGDWVSGNSFISNSIMPYNSYRRSILRPDSVANWEEVSSDVLEMQIPYSKLTPENEYEIIFNSHVDSGFEYEYDNYEIHSADENYLCNSYMFIDVTHSYLKNVNYTRENLIYRPHYKIMETNKEFDEVNNYNKETANSIKFKAPTKSIMDSLDQDECFSILISARGVNKLKLQNMFLRNINSGEKQELSSSKELNSQIKENLISINLKYAALNLKLNYIDPLIYDDMMMLRNYLFELATQYGVNISPPWRSITKDSSYLMARDYNDITSYCFNLFTQLKSKYPTVFKGNPNEFKSLPIIKAGETRVVNISASGKPSVDRRGKTYFSEWDDLIDAIKNQGVSSGTVTPIVPPSTPSEPVVPAVDYAFYDFLINDNQVLNLKDEITIKEVNKFEFVISSPEPVNKVKIAIAGKNAQTIWCDKTGVQGFLHYFRSYIQFKTAGADTICVTAYDKNNKMITTYVSTNADIPVQEPPVASQFYYKTVMVDSKTVNTGTTHDIVTIDRTSTFECIVHNNQYAIDRVEIERIGTTNTILTFKPKSVYNNDYYFKETITSAISGRDTWAIRAYDKNGRLLLGYLDIIVHIGENSSNGKINIIDFKINTVSVLKSNTVLALNKKEADIYLIINTVYPLTKLVIQTFGANGGSTTIKMGSGEYTGRCYYSEKIPLNNFGQDQWLLTLYDSAGNTASVSAKTLLNYNYLY